MLHIPILRRGKPYRSLDLTRTPHHLTRESFVEISQANVGLIRRDLMDLGTAREALAGIPAHTLFAICSRAAERFANGALPVGDDVQSAPDYIEQVSATTGLPHVLVRRNMQKIQSVLAGAREVTARPRSGGRLVTRQGCSYLLPTIVECAPEHPLANREFLFPFASVEQRDVPEIMGPSLVVTAITSDRQLIGRLLSSPLVGRSNLGAIPTNHISWDQPHEGNLFDHLYARRAFQNAYGAMAG